MNDKIIEAMKYSRLTRENISFDKLREIAGSDNGLWAELKRGRAVLTSTGELDQYLYSYGLMIKSQWSQFLVDVSLPANKMRLTDYGCGQGIGSALLFDHFGPSFVKRIEEIRLIEPSSVALERAKAVVDCYVGAKKSVAINRAFDGLCSEDMKIDDDLPHIHLLSNVLDIEGFDQARLFSGMFSDNVGDHIVLAVSHDRAHNGGSDRFEKLEAEIKNPKHSTHLRVLSSNVKKFALPDGKLAIAWHLHVKVL